MALNIKVVVISVIVALVVAGAIVGIVFAVKGGDEDNICSGTPLINNLRFGEKEEGLLVEWDNIENATTYCTLNYEVELKYSINGEIITSKYTETPNFLLTIPIPICAILTVKVTPIAVEGSKGDPVTIDFEREIGKIENFNVTFNDGKLEFSWTGLDDDKKHCEYHIVYEEDPINNVVITDSIYVYDLDLNDLQLPSCSPNNFAIYATGQGENSSPESTFTFEAGILADVGPIELEETASNLKVTWKEPINTENCETLKYVVRYLENGEKIEEQTTDQNARASITFVKFNTEVCSGYSVEVDAIESTEEAPRKRTTFRNKISGVDDVSNLQVNREDDSLKVTWDAASNPNSCKNLLYRISYSEGETVTTKQTENTQWSFDLVSELCTTVEISVLPVVGKAEGLAIIRTYDVEGKLEAVTDLEASETDGLVKVTWTAPSDVGRCANLKYKVKYSDETETKEVEVIGESIDLQLNPCTDVTITVFPIVGTTEGQSTNITHTVEGGLGAVGDLTADASNASLLSVSWTRPSNSDACEDLLYKISYPGNEEWQETNETSISFDLNAEPCTVGEVSVIPFVGDITGKEEKAEYTVDGIPKITNLQLSDENGNMAIKWKLDDQYTSCELTYKVTYYIDGKEIDSDTTEDEEYTFENVATCALVTVIVVPLSSDGEPIGEPLINTYELDITEVKGATVEFDDGRLVFSWSALDNSKYCKYHIYLNEADVLETNMGVTTYTHDLDAKDIGVQSCIENTFSIRALGQGSKVGSVSQFTLDAGLFAKVDEVTFNYPDADNLLVTWKKPKNTDSCQGLKYNVVYKEGEKPTKVETESINLLLTTDVDACSTITVGITPTTDTLTGRPNNNDHSVGVVGGISASEADGTLTVTWVAPVNDAQCTLLKYKINVEYSDSTPTKSYEVSDTKHSFDIASDPCTTITIQILPVNDRVQGTPSTYVHVVEGGLEAVGDLTADVSNGLLSVSWTRPSNSDACKDLRYKISYPGNEEGKETDETNISFNLNAELCTVGQVSVIPFVGDITGKEKKAEYTVDGVLEAVGDLTADVSNGLLSVSWTRPSNSDACKDLRYKISYPGNEEGKETDETNISFNLNAEPCTVGEVSVIPFVGDITGKEEKAEYTVDGIPKITNLQLSDENGNMAIKWELDDQYTSCELTYKVTYYIDGKEIDSDTTGDEEYTFENVATCALVTVTVVPLSSDGEPIGQPLTKTYELDITEVKGATVEFDDGRLVFSWSALDNSEYCKYHIYLNEADVLETNMGVITYTHDLDAKDIGVQSCIENTFSIRALGQGSKVGSVSQFTLDAGLFAKVDEVTFNYPDADNLLVTWKKPKNTDSCQGLKYNVVYKEGEKPTKVETESINLLLTTDVDACSTITVGITPTTDTLTGRPNNNYHSVGVVGGISASEADGTLTVTWVAPVNDAQCTLLKYKINVEYSDSTPTKSYEVSDTKHSFDIASDPCTTITIQILPVNDGVQGTPSTYVHVVEGGLEAVGDLTADVSNGLLSVSWTRPSNSDACKDLRYKISYPGNEEGKETVETNISFNLNAELCTVGQVSVIPFVGDITGKEEKAEYTVDGVLEAVGDLTADVSNGLLSVSWTRPSNSDACKDLRYKISYPGNEEGKETVETNISFDLNAEPCTVGQVSVIPFVGDITGKEEKAEYTVDGVLEAVGDLTADVSNGLLSVSWTRPSNSDACKDLRYKISYPGNEEGKETDETNISFNLNAEPCTVGEVSVIPFVGDITGKEEKAEYTVDGGLEAVGDLTADVSNGLLSVSWTRPSNSDACKDLRYKISYPGNEEGKQTVETNISFDLNAEPCTVGQVSVIPFVGDITGKEEKAEYTVDGIPKITNLQLSDENGNMAITWKLLDTACELTYEVKYYIDGNEIDSDTTGDEKYTFENVATCALVTVTVVPLSSDGEPIGQPLTKTYELDITEVKGATVEFDDGRLVFSWSALDNSEYCKYHIYLNEADVLETNMGVITYTHDLDAKDIGVQSCIENTFSIRALGQGSKVGSVSQFTLDAGLFAKVDEIAFNVDEADKLLVTWNKPKNTASCDGLKYVVVYKEGETELDPKEVGSESTNFDVVACSTITVEITPKTETLMGRPNNNDHTVLKVGAVSGLSVSEADGKLTATWSPPANAMACNDLKYDVEYNDGKATDTETIKDDKYTFEIKSDPCTIVSVKVTPNNNGVTGKEDSESHNVDIGKVNNLLITREEGEDEEEADQIHVTWDVPSSIESCSKMKYNVVFTEDELEEVKESTIERDVLFKLVNPECTNIHVTVTPESEESEGETASHDYACAVDPAVLHI